MVLIKFDIIQLLTGDKGNTWYVGPEDKSDTFASLAPQKCCPRTKAEGNILSEGPKYYMLPNLIIVLLYLHWFMIKYSGETTYKQTDHDRTGLNLDGLIWDKLALV